MPEIEKGTQDWQMSRRQFLKNAGIVVGGTAVGSAFLLTACGDGGEITKTITKTTTVPGQTLTTTAAGTTQTVTKTAAGTTAYVCPYDNQQFATLAELKAHLESEHLAPSAAEGLITLTVNGAEYIVQVRPEWSLAFVLREKLGLPALKIGCDRGECGTCTVIVSGRAVYSCCMLAMDADGMQVETVEGLSDGVNLHPVQQAFVDNNAVQCGYCTCGFLMAAKALLDTNPNPTRYEVREALSGHLCVCGNTKRSIDAVLSV